MKPFLANGIALLAALTWGIGGVPQKTVLEHLDPFTVTAITCLIGALVVLPFAQQQEHGTASKPPLREIFVVALPFSLGVSLSQIGYGLTSVTNAGFFGNTAAVITPFAAWVLHRQRPRSWIFMASVLAAGGLILMSGGGLTTPSAGDALCLLAALAFSIWIVMLGDHVAHYRNPGTITCWQLAFCGGGCMALGLLWHGLPSASQLVAALPELLVIGVLSKGLAFCLSAAAQQHIHPSSAAILISAEAVFGSLFAVLLINESLSLWQALGALLVIMGIVLVSTLQDPAVRKAG